jgi:hypothetical protein
MQVCKVTDWLKQKEGQICPRDNKKVNMKAVNQTIQHSLFYLNNNPNSIQVDHNSNASTGEQRYTNEIPDDFQLQVDELVRE